jgi:hypothetical protein
MMKKLLPLLFILTAFISNAQNNLDKITGLSSTTASVAYSLRQLSTSYTGPLVRIKLGTSFYDVYPDASTNKFSLSSKISTSISTYDAGVTAASTNALSTIISGSIDATIAIWYDQSGNGVHVLSNTSAAKIITAGNINTLYGQPTIYFSGNNGESLLTSSNTVDYSALSGATVNLVAQNVATTSAVGGIFGAAKAIAQPGYNISYGGTGSGYLSDGGGCEYKTSFSSTNPQIVTSIFTNTTTNLSNTYINGVLKTNSGSNCNLTHTSGSKIYIGSARGYGPFSFNGNISEAILFPSQLSDAVRNPLETNQTQTYFSPAVTIASSASGAVCAGTSVTFTATTYNFSGTPTYQWYKNGTAINGANSASYSTTILSNNDVISVSCSDASSIVSDNSLSLWLDAANGTTISGNTWSDLSGKGKHATLSSDQSYSSADGGTIQFNGGQNAVSMPLVSNKTNDITMQTWVYLDANTKGPFFKNGYNNGYVFGTGNGGNGFELGNRATMLFAGTRWIQATNTNYGYGWKLVTMVINSTGVPSMYINNSLVPGTYTGTSASVPTNGTYLGRNVGDDDANWPKFNGKMAAAYFYTKALSQSEITQNYNALAARFGLSSSSSISSNAITTIISPAPSSTITVNGDGCANKTTLTTPAGATAYAWYKDNVAISGATNNTYIPTAAGAYQVQVTSGSCSNTSTVTTIYTCVKTPEGKMLPISASTRMVTSSGEINNKYGVDEKGLLLTKPYANIPTGTNPVTTGLILYLDATRSASYGGSGNIWTDISGQSPAGSATLVGNPTFGSGNTANGSGSFTFGSNINAATSKTYTIDNEITYIAWVNPSQSFDGGVIVRRTDTYGGATSLYLANSNLSYDWDNANWSWRSNLTVPNNQWSMIVISVNAGSVTAYLCNASGINSVSSGRGHGSLSSKPATNFHIGYDPYDTAGRAFKGKMGTAMVYSVALSTSDITSIFTAQKSAFGL